MGGTINVFLREPSGVFHRMRRWTNPVPDFSIGACWAENPQPIIDDYMTSFYQMQEDWRRNRKTKKFHYNMTDMYFPAPTKICWSEYGAVLIDFVTRTYYARNEYNPNPFEIMGFYVQDTSIHGPEKRNAVYLALEHNRLYIANKYRREFSLINSEIELEKRLNESKDDIGMSNAIFYAPPPGWTIDGDMRYNMTSTQYKEHAEQILQGQVLPG